MAERDDEHSPARVAENRGPISADDRRAIFDELASMATDTATTYWVVLLLAGAIALLGLALNSAAVVIGAMLAIMRMSHKAWLARPALWFIEFYRNTPPLVHFFWAFYGLPVLLGVSLSPYVAAIIALSTQSGAFYAEVVRGGVVSIERGQWEAARAIGMSSAQVLRRVILPQATQRIRLG